MKWVVVTYWKIEATPFQSANPRYVPGEISSSAAIVEAETAEEAILAIGGDEGYYSVFPLPDRLEIVTTTLTVRGEAK